jgi:hypothetical protein
MRSFFKMDPSRISGHGDEVASASATMAGMVSGGSTLSACKLGVGSSVRGSVLAKVTTLGACSCEGAILVNVTAAKIDVAPGCVVYNVASSDPNGIVLTEPGSVLTTALLHAEASPPVEGAVGGGAAAAAAGGAEVEGSVREVTMRSTTETDGGQVWKTCVLGNPYSFEQVYEFNGDADVSGMEAASKAIHAAAAAKLGLA